MIRANEDGRSAVVVVGTPAVGGQLPTRGGDKRLDSRQVNDGCMDVRKACYYLPYSHRLTLCPCP